MKGHSTQLVTAGMDLGPGQRNPARQPGAYGWQPGAGIRIQNQNSESELILFYPSSGSTNNILLYSFEHENSM